MVVSTSIDIGEIRTSADISSMEHRSRTKASCRHRYRSPTSSGSMLKWPRQINKSCHEYFEIRTIETTKMKIPQTIPPKTVVRLSRYDATTPEWRRSIG